MRAGVNLIPEGSIAHTVELARHAEELGYARCWVYDEGLASHDVHVVMAAIAAATSRIEIGTGITNAYTRHPAQTIAAIASLDELSGGRAFLGLGAGGSLTLNPLGLERSAPLATLREMVAAARGLFAGERMDLDGAAFTLRGATIPRGRADTEIWFAGRGDKMLRLGGEICDGVMLDFIHRPSLADYVARARSARTDVRICYSTTIVTEPSHLEAVRPHLTYRLVDSPPAVRAELGIGDDDVAAIAAAMGQGLHAAGALVRDEWAEPFVIGGTPDGCAGELRRIVEAYDIEEFLLPVYEMADEHGYLEQVAAVLAAAGADLTPSR
jgi:5,10-methylenetetrahydromethanopterin reductase